MKYLKLFAIYFLLISNFCFSEQTIQLLCVENIDKNAIVIETQINRERYLAYGITAVGVAQNMYALALIGQSLFYGQSAYTLGTQMFAQGTELFTTSQGWWQLAECGAEMAKQTIIQSSSLFFMSYMSKKLIHPNTLRWYVSAKVPYKTTIASMKDVAARLQYESLEMTQIAHYKASLRASSDRLARYGESMCGYMTYKSKQLPEREQLNAEREQRYFFNYYNDWIKRVGELLDQDVIDFDALNQLIASHEVTIKRMVDDFSAVEGEVRREPRQIKPRQ